MKFLNDIILTGAGADLTAPATVTFSGLSTTTETNAVVINSSGVLSKRTLGSNAFNSTTIPTNAVLTTGNQTIAGVKTFSNNLTVGSNSLTAGSLDINGNADISGNLTGVDAFTASGKIQGAELEGTSLDINGNGDVSGTLNVTGSITTSSAGVNGNLYANRYIQNATGIPTNNLGAPTVTEMALFENQFRPQTTLANSYDDLADLTFFTRASGTGEGDYAEVTSYSDDQKRKFLRTHNSSVVIPNGHNSFRIEFVAKYYTFANAMVAYWSSQSHNSQVHVWKRRCDNNEWYQHTSSTTTVSSWPGHLYLPFGTIAWNEDNTTSSGHYNKIRIEFTNITWSTGSYSDRDILLYGMQIWGGYPSGKRTVHNYDQNGKLDLFKDLGLPDNGVATFGSGDDLKIYHDGSNSYIEDSGTGNLKIRTNALNVMNAANSETMLSATENGAVSLYYDNALKLTTASGGINITGELEADSLDIDGNADISGTLSGNFVVRSTNNANTDGANFAVDTTNKSADEYAYEVLRSGTTVAGITMVGKITGTELEGTSLDINGNADISGTLTIVAPTANLHAATKAYVDGAVIANTDTQDLSQSGNTVSLVDGGSVDISATTAVAANTSHAASAHAPSNAEQNVQSDWNATSGDAFIDNKPTIPSGNQIIDWTSDQGSTNIHAGNYTDTDTVYTHPTTAGNKHIPTGGASGEFLKYTASGTAVWATPSYIANTDTNKFLSGISKSSNTLTFTVTGGTNQTYTFGANAFNSTTIPAAESYTQHENISAATSVNGTGRAYIQDITVDSNGHVTGIATATETVVNTNTQNSAATTRGFFSGSGINTSTGVITNTTYGSATTEARGLVMVGDGLSITETGVLSATASTDATTSASGDMSSQDKTKLDGIESLADKTDATNVAAAGASMKTSTETISGAKTFSSLTTISNTTDSSSAAGTNGALRTAGGASVAKKLYVGSTITGSADVIAYSDKRLKKNVKTLDGKKVLEMRGVSFERTDSGKQSSGVIAQEMEKVAPELVIDDGNYKGVAYGNVVGYLIEAIKDQQKQIDELKELCNGCSK